MSRRIPVVDRNKGFSVVELMIVVALVFVCTAISLYYATSHKKAFKPDEQAAQIVDLLQEGRQRALTQRRVMRVEINLTANIASLYDENTNASSAGDDVRVRYVKLYDTSAVRVDAAPSEIAYNPPEALPVTTAVFKPSVYTPSIAQTVCTIRFLPNGTATDAGTNPIGTGALPTGVTLHIWSPNPATPTQSNIARAITVLGATAAIRKWEFRRDATIANKWFDSRRIS